MLLAVCIRMLTLPLVVILTFCFAGVPHANAQTSQPRELSLTPPVSPTSNERLPAMAGFITASSYLGGWVALSLGSRNVCETLSLASTAGIVLVPSFGYGYAGELTKGLGLSVLSVFGSF